MHTQEKCATADISLSWQVILWCTLRLADILGCVGEMQGAYKWAGWQGPSAAAAAQSCVPARWEMFDFLLWTFANPLGATVNQVPDGFCKQNFRDKCCFKRFNISFNIFFFFFYHWLYFMCRKSICLLNPSYIVVYAADKLLLQKREETPKQLRESKKSGVTLIILIRS